MSETNSRTALNFSQGAGGPVLTFLFYEGADLTGLKTIFLGWRRVKQAKQAYALLESWNLPVPQMISSSWEFLTNTNHLERCEKYKIPYGVRCSSFAGIRRAGSNAQN
jgi:hypothetical protein